jgi:RNA methyltransferase, TrmH family
MTLKEITSAQNPKVKLIKKLRNKRGREQENRFVIDSDRDLIRAMNCVYNVDYLLYCPELGSHEDINVLEHLHSSQVYEIPPELMSKVSYRQNPTQFVAVMRQKKQSGMDDLQNVSNSPVLALVNLQKPGNIGALLRTADASGFKSIFLVDTALDIYNPNIIRSSTGASFLNNIYSLSSAEALRFFHKNEYTIFATALDGSVDIFAADFQETMAIVLGTEDKGLDSFWLENADFKIKIPMMGILSDSLNVSVSGAIIMYEVLRQTGQ